MKQKNVASEWTKHWRSVYKLGGLDLDQDLITDLQSALRKADLAVCGEYYELQPADEPSHIWYFAIYPDDSVRVQVRGGPSLAFKDLDQVLEFYPAIDDLLDEWDLRDAVDSVREDRAVV